MPPFSREIVVSAPVDRVWSVVSDVDNEPAYWHGTRQVVNRSRDGSSIDRMIIQNFMGTKIDQKVILRPMESVVTEYLRGVTIGTKKVTVSQAEGGTRVKVVWDIRFTGLVKLITPYVRHHVVKGTENALLRIKQAAEEANTVGRS